MITSVETIVRALINQLEDGWNGADGEAFAVPFTEDGHVVDIRGQHHQGRDLIAQGHQEIFDTIGKDSLITYELLQAHALTDNTSLAHAMATLNTPSGPLGGEHNAVTTVVVIEQDGSWQIASLQGTPIAPAR